MKKRKLKIKNIIKLLAIIVFIIIAVIMCTRNQDFKVVLNSKTMEVGKEYTNNFKATFKGVDVTNEVTVTNNIYNTKLGKYQITFTYKHDGKEYQKVKTITIVDNSKPEITLKGGEELITLINEEFKDPGYTAKDNYDGDITAKVKINSTVDITKEGEYQIKYTVTDSSNNTTEVIRIVKVVTTSPLSMSLEEFNLNGYFKGTILEETKDAGEEYQDKIIFAGDSMPLYYVINKQIYGRQLWHRESINPETALKNTIYINHQESNLTFIEAYKEYQPEISIMTLGTNSVAYMELDYFIDCYRTLLQGIIEASPKTILIVQAIPPVDKSYDTTTRGITNDKINKFNYHIAQLCSELDLPFLNSAVAMKDENGQCKEGYCRKGNGENGIHPTTAGNEALMKYTRTHAVSEGI